MYSKTTSLYSIIILLSTFLHFISADSTDSTESSAQATSSQPDEVVLLTRLVSDVATNANEYIHFFETQTQVPIPLNLIGTLRQITTYTDDSYTTLAENLALMGSVESLVTVLPWYESRIVSGDGDGKVLSLSDVGSVSGSASGSSGSSSKSSNESQNGGAMIAGGVFAMCAGLLLAI
ncbi:predicted protein [Lodderomyces elongisporus NRRL YB-4239]|uniref:Temperature shock-inducible protein 1 n=1 Tax=Lodderomyces elongisporus (strain ATCC 11503 / CBS 2605 / JCM 1781 / NBRC 1676 / NRRL YB-4239) TaxID=379508 RepID=A5E6S9_LODEL|nr:predicted protein [Lodderomyces elongisporus NRRL YB-4239]